MHPYSWTKWHRPRDSEALGFTALRAVPLGFGQVLLRTEEGTCTVPYVHAWLIQGTLLLAAPPPGPMLLKARIFRNQEERALLYNNRYIDVALGWVP